MNRGCPMTGGGIPAPMRGAPLRFTGAHHVERMVAMVLKAVGLTPNGRLGRVMSVLAWQAMRYRVGRLAKAAA